MATSLTEIFNNALQGLKANRIMSGSDDTETADMCEQVWPSVRDAVLRSHPWNCAMKLAQLQQSATAPAWKWDYAYPLPADCLRVVEVVGADEGALEVWETVGGEVLCNEAAPVYISYVWRETDPTKYDALLCKVLEAALAAEIAYPLTASVTARQAAQASYEDRMREARGVDSRQGQTYGPVVPSTWRSAKLGGRWNR